MDRQTHARPVRRADKAVAAAARAVQVAYAAGAMAWAIAQGLLVERQVLRAMRGQPVRSTRAERRRDRQRRWGAISPSALRDDVVTADAGAGAVSPLDQRVDAFLDQLEADPTYAANHDHPERS